jgi:cation diffusion facilitator family transporter
MAEESIKIAAYSTMVNAALVLPKGLLAMHTGSDAVLAETIHSITDLIGSLSVLAGIALSKKKLPSFPWGLYKVENIAAIISALFIFLMAYEVGKDIFFASTRQIRNINLTIIGMLVMVVPIYIFARYEKRKAAELNSPSLRADAEHWIADITSIGVVIGGLAGLYVSFYADKIAAVVVLIFISKTGFGIIKDSMKSLLDASVDVPTLDRIKIIIGNFKEVEEITRLHARNSGRFIFVHLSIILSVKRLKEAHRIADDIEKAIREAIPFVERVVIHYEPEERDFLRVGVPLADRAGNVSVHFGSAPFIAVWNRRISDGAIFSQAVLENPFLTIEKGKGIKLAEFLVEKGVDMVYVKDYFEGKGPVYVFSDAGVDVRSTNLKNLKEITESEKGSAQ